MSATKSSTDTIQIDGWRDITADNINEISSSVKDNHVTIENSVFTGLIIFKGEHPTRLSIKNCTFENLLYFGKGFIGKENILIENCVFKEPIVFEDDILFEKDFQLFSSDSTKIYFYGGTYNHLYLSLKTCTDIYLIAGEFKGIIVRCQTTIQKIKIDAYSIKGRVNLQGTATLAVIDLVIKGGSAELDLSISDMCVHKLYFFRFFPGKGLKLFNIKPVDAQRPSEFVVADSNLGAAEFYDVDLKNFRLVSIFDSYLIDAIFIGTTWPKNFYYYGYGYVDGEQSEYGKYYEALIEEMSGFSKYNYVPKNIRRIGYDERGNYKLKETFRQLKNCYGKQGDLQAEHEFHVLEMRYLFRHLTWSQDGFQKLIIKFSFLFSEFGKSIKRPILGLLGFHWILVLFSIWVGAIPSLTFSTTINSQGLNEGVFQYFFLINPFRDFDVRFAGWFIIIDVVMRIWSSFMLYNIIRATRRYIK